MDDYQNIYDKIDQIYGPIIPVPNKSINSITKNFIKWHISFYFRVVDWDVYVAAIISHINQYFDIAPKVISNVCAYISENINKKDVLSKYDEIEKDFDSYISTNNDPTVTFYGRAGSVTYTVKKDLSFQRFRQICGIIAMEFEIDKLGVGYYEGMAISDNFLPFQKYSIRKPEYETSSDYINRLGSKYLTPSKDKNLTKNIDREIKIIMDCLETNAKQISKIYTYPLYTNFALLDLFNHYLKKFVKLETEEILDNIFDIFPEIQEGRFLIKNQELVCPLTKFCGCQVFNEKNKLEGVFVFGKYFYEEKISRSYQDIRYLLDKAKVEPDKELGYEKMVINLSGNLTSKYCTFQ